jgi:hypothetical protein
MTLYHVFDADYENDAYPDIREIYADTPQEAGKAWAKEKWASYDYPDGMECIATEAATGKRYRVGISVEAEPVFFASSREEV